jgi:putative acetyltransferase
VHAAFEGKPYAEGDEAELIDRLREKGDLTVSLVAEVDGELVGQVAFSPALPSDGSTNWFALGPVAVLPAHQRQGIGSRLVRAGLEAISELGGRGCILVGDPNYYTRFGFRRSPSNVPAGEPAEYFMMLVLSGSAPNGPIGFDPAFHSAT